MKRSACLCFMAGFLLVLLAAPIRAELALAWDDAAGAYGLAANAPNGPEAIAKALADCRKLGGGAGCRVLSSGDLRGFGAIFESCSARGCVQGSSAGHVTREAAHAAARERCQVNHRIPVCWLLVDWEEFGISELPPADGKTDEIPRSTVKAGRKLAGAPIDGVLKAAAAGDAEAASMLGQLAVAQGALSHARQWFLQAAEGGQADAKAMLGVFLLYGIGGDPADADAARWLAPLFPGVMRLPDPDPHLPVRYRRLEIRAYTGEPAAQAALGHRYREGQNGVSRDIARAAFWLEHAARNGEMAAQGILGIDRYVGQPGVAPDREQGFTWIKRSANLGFAPAQSFLGVILESRGWKAQAIAQFQKAAAQGDAMALRKLETLGVAVDTP